MRGSDTGFGFGEPELDANTALTELDKGLRSTKLGDQVEAIVRFPALFERYPFPILINSAFLKLADVFRTGSNFLRLWVLRVCQQSERHLDKILNVDEFVRRIFSVIYANDPIARALTLRTLGSLAGLIPEKKKIHHSIRVALDSNDKVEVAAAISAASCFAQKSRTFGTTMCMKIASMVQRLSTPIDLKLKLIPIFQHMHHDVQTAAMVRKLCVELLVNYPSQQFVSTILHTLTQLAAATITDLSEQVTFLLTYLEDSRTEIKIDVLKDLKFLGDKGGHLWEPVHVSTFIDCVTRNMGGGGGPDQMEVDGEQGDVVLNEGLIGHCALDVIHSIASSSAVLPFILNQNSSLIKLLENNIHSSDMIASLKAIRITTDLAVHWKSTPNSQTGGTYLLNLASSGIESLLTSLSSQTSEDLAEESFRNEVFLDLERCLACGVMLAKTDNSKCEWLCGILIRLFQLPGVAARNKNLIAQAIGSIGSLNLESAVKYLPDILHILKKFDKSDIESENSTVAALIGIVFQAHQGHVLAPKTASVIQGILNASNLWLVYRIARNSLKYAQPETAAVVLETLKLKVVSENYQYWLSALHFVAKAENALAESKTQSLISKIRSASNLYMQGVSTIKAATSPSNSLQFQIEYMRLRSEMLVAFVNLLVCCNTLQLSPPADIASNMANMLRDELLKSGRAVTQLRKCIREFQNINEMYGRLYQTAFDADSDSLLNIQILQQLCNLISRSVEKQVVSKDHPSCSDDDQSLMFFRNMTYQASGNSWTLIMSCKKAIDVLQTTNSLSSQALTMKHIDALREIVRLITESPLPYPRFFFQTLQMTRAKIAVSPQPRNFGEAVTILNGNNLALKVEGVLLQNASNTNKSRPPICFRKPKSIRLTVVATPHPNPRLHMMDPLKNAQEPVTLVKDVTPHRDFFQAQFLLMVASWGLTTVTVDTSLVDFEGRVWMTGPRATLSVKVLEDSNLSGKQVPTMSIPGPGPGPSSRPMPINLVPGTSAMTARY